MYITSRNRVSTEISDANIRNLLGMYAEEDLIHRPVFQNALSRNSIEFKDLKDESEKIIIPWQLFFLNDDNLRKEIAHITSMRVDKFSKKIVAKRKGAGSITSKRILDRLIRMQNFICSNAEIPQNTYCGSLIGMTDENAVKHIVSHFSLDRNRFWETGNKAAYLSYLIKQIENKYINISQGVLTNKMLPMFRVVDNTVYKNTSGFVIKDEKIPFIFLPSEINPNETEGRQIYTLIYLIVLIGLNQYNFCIERDFSADAIIATGKLANIYRITSELLMPWSRTESLGRQIINSQLIDNLAAKYKITPTAVVVILRIRKIIKTKNEYEALLPAPYVPLPKTGHMNAPRVETSVRKFCGKYSFQFINGAIKSRVITGTQAQYLLFGGVNKTGYSKYRRNLYL